MNDVAQLGRWQTRALLLGLIAGGLSLLGAFVSRAQFFHSYLFAWLFWSGLSFGALVVLMMQFLTGGLWGLALRNLALAALATVPLMALLFLPVLLGLRDIYVWAHGFLGETGGYHHKAQWLNIPFFTARSIFYFAILVSDRAPSTALVARAGESESCPDKNQRAQCERSHRLRPLHELRFD